MRGFLLDLNRCTGCQACTLACSIENSLGAGNSWRQVLTFNGACYPGVSRFHLSLACMHCSDPACLAACPASAYRRDHQTGAVLLDTARCIGCKYCNWACPFDAPRYDRNAGTISKCTLCHDRLVEGNPPACTALCPTGALQFAELPEEGGRQHIAGFPAADIGPAMRFTPLRQANSGPETSAVSACLPGVPAGSISGAAASKVAIESEWSLVFFSLGAALLVAIAAAAFAGAMSIDPLDFLVAALGTIGITALHLGKWRRAWRAILNMHQSWLSREIAFFSAFAVLATILLFFPVSAPLLTWPAALTGFGALLCIDRVYETVSGNRWIRLHSARVLLTGLLLFGVLTENLPIAGLVGLLKLISYSYRQSWFLGRSRALVSILRLGLGFVAPLALWGTYRNWVLPLILIAEVVDRCEYYLDLDITTPRSQIAADLHRTLVQGTLIG